MQNSQPRSIFTALPPSFKNKINSCLSQPVEVLDFDSSILQEQFSKGTNSAFYSQEDMLTVLSAVRNNSEDDSIIHFLNPTDVAYLNFTTTLNPEEVTREFALDNHPVINLMKSITLRLVFLKPRTEPLTVGTVRPYTESTLDRESGQPIEKHIYRLVLNVTKAELGQCMALEGVSLPKAYPATTTPRTGL